MDPARVMILNTSTVDYCILLSAYCFALPWPSHFNPKLSQAYNDPSTRELTHIFEDKFMLVPYVQQIEIKEALSRN